MRHMKFSINKPTPCEWILYNRVINQVSFSQQVTRLSLYKEFECSTRVNEQIKPVDRNAHNFKSPDITILR